MEFATVLYNLLAAGAGLAATAGAGELGKQAVTTAFAAIKTRLSSAHAVGGLDMLDKPAFAEGVKSELAKPEIATDPDLPGLIEALRAALAAIPQGSEARYAVDIREGIEAARNISMKDIEGLRAHSLVAREGDITLENIKAPPGKS